MMMKHFNLKIIGLVWVVVMGVVLLCPCPNPTFARRMRGITENVIRLHMSQRQVDEIIDHSKREYPIEACGILAGKDEKVERVYQITNTKKSSTEYLMDPEEVYKVIVEIEDLGLEIVGIYHSHIEEEAYPTPRDVEMAYLPDVAYMIISLKDIDNPVVRLFRIIDGKITEGELHFLNK